MCAVSFQQEQSDRNQSEIDGILVPTAATCPIICIIFYFNLITNTVGLLLLEKYCIYRGNISGHSASVVIEKYLKANRIINILGKG